jgi:hypothetical protein
LFLSTKSSKHGIPGTRLHYPPFLHLLPYSSNRERKIGKTDLKRTREGCCAHGRLFLLFHDGVMLAYAGDHAKAHTKSHESRMYDSGQASYLSCSYGSCIPCSGEGIHCGMHNILRARIWPALTLIPLLATIVLWLGVASPDSFGVLHIAAFVTLCEA